MTLYDDTNQDAQAHANSAHGIASHVDAGPDPMAPVDGDDEDCVDEEGDGDDDT